MGGILRGDDFESNEVYRFNSRWNNCIRGREEIQV